MRVHWRGVRPAIITLSCVAAMALASGPVPG